MEREVFTISDVYEHAASIGKDIEFIVSEYGKESIEEIMPKIVYVLEQLETLAEKHQEDTEKMASLMIEREKFLIHSNRDKAIQRQLEEKLSYMESLVSKDKRDLEQKVKLLEEENECLVEELEKRDGELVKERSNGALPGDVEVMLRMKSTIDEQRDQIRLYKHEVQAQRTEAEALQEQVTRLGNINEQLRRDSDDTETRPQEHVETGKETTVQTEELRIEDSNTSLLDELKSQDASYNEQDTANSSFTELGTSICLTTDESNQKTDETTPLVQEGPIRKDPNRPRYTLKEMQSLLEERNLYKIEKMALEEELELYKGSAPNILKEAQSAPVNVNQLNNKPAGVRTFMQKFLGK